MEENKDLISQETIDNIVEEKEFESKLDITQNGEYLITIKKEIIPFDKITNCYIKRVASYRGKEHDCYYLIVTTGFIGCLLGEQLTIVEDDKLNNDEGIAVISDSNELTEEVIEYFAKEFSKIRSQQLIVINS